MPRAGGVGVKGVHESKRAEQRAREVGEQARAQYKQQLYEQLQELKQTLQKLAATHRKKIVNDPEFRAHFSKMCAFVGVDPLASQRSIAAKAFGWWGDLDYELGVQTIEACISLRRASGGLVPLNDALAFVQHRRGPHAARVGIEDIARAVNRLKPLGGGWGIITTSGERFVRSLPVELDDDHGAVLSSASNAGGFLSCTSLSNACGWSAQRAQAALDGLVDRGLAMIDDPPGRESERLFWFPCLQLSDRWAESAAPAASFDR